MQPPFKQSRLLFLESLRGLAALAVVLVHCDFTLRIPEAVVDLQKYIPNFHLFWSGSSAVGFFFVLSGFVLFRAYSTRIHAKSPQSVAAFLVQRAFRIYPAFIAILCLGFVMRSLFLHYFPTLPRDMRSFWEEPFSVPYFVSQLSLIFPTERAHLIVADWSLEWELKFSILFPVLCFLLNLHWLWVSLLTAVLILLFQVKTLLFHFTLGMLIASYYRPEQSWITRSSAIGKILLLGIGLYLYAFRYTIPLDLPGIPRAEWYWYLNAVGASLIILLALSSSRFQKCLSFPPLRFIGRVSYSLFLVHYPVLLTLTPIFVEWLRRAGMETQWQIQVLGIGFTILASLALSAILYRFVELPGIQLGKIASNRITGSRPDGGAQVISMDRVKRN